jgi:para-nitrobenzyl esterase
MRLTVALLNAAPIQFVGPLLSLCEIIRWRGHSCLLDRDSSRSFCRPPNKRPDESGRCSQEWLGHGITHLLTLCLLISAAVLCASEPLPALIEAARNNDAARVTVLLAQHADVNARAQDGTTALGWAAMRGDADLVAKLLKAGANPNLANLYGAGPLWVAVSNGFVPIVKLLLDHDTDPDLARENGETPLMLAARLGQVEIARMLLDRGAEVNRRDQKFGQTALMWAAGYADMVRLLLEHKADPRVTTKQWDVTATIYTPGFRTLGVTGIPWNFDGDYTSKKGGQTPLFFAVQKRNLESAKLLLDAGLDVNAASADGTTPLLLALYKWDNTGSRPVFTPDLEMANLLLDRGAKVNVADGAGYTPLHGAVLAVVTAMRGGRDATARPRIPAARGGRPSTGLIGGLGAGTPLSADAASKMVQRLLEAGADPNRTNQFPTSGPVGNLRINPASPGSSPYHIAATINSAPLARLLAEHGANPNLLRKDGETPFTLAVEGNSLDVVKEMVAQGADLTMRYSPAAVVSHPVKPIATRRKNQTIMHLAADAGATRVIEYLFSIGVPLEVTNAQGETPRRMAEDHEIFEEVLAYEGVGAGGGKRVPRNTTTSQMIRKLLNVPSDELGDRVETDQGWVSGGPAKKAGVRAFKGVAYAQPPVGSLRWRAPEPVKEWVGLKLATDFSPNCTQPSKPGDPVSSEDCLYLNIWTGAQKSTERRPVLVWIHGGGFSAGSGRDARIDGENLAARGIVMLTLNYRVGPLGFLAHSELTKESAYHASGNYGLLDQVAALKWVQRNIAAFGGDPQNVTIGGNSAGALCVNLLVASPLAKGLFKRVIAESGAVAGDFSVSYPQSLEAAEAAGLKYMTAVGANSLAQLRAMPATDLLKLPGGRPDIDGYVVPKDPHEVFAKGQQNDVPVLTGWNRDDVAGQGPANARTFTESVRQRYGAYADEILRAFPATTDEQAKRSASNLSRDVLFAWQGYTWVRLHERVAQSPAYLYFFTRVPADTPEQMARGAYHGVESPYALDNLNRFTRPYEPTDRKLSELMSSYWINFITTGNPNGTGLPEWKPFSAKADHLMEFGDSIEERPVPFKSEMNALDLVSAKMRNITQLF